MVSIRAARNVLEVTYVYPPSEATFNVVSREILMNEPFRRSGRGHYTHDYRGEQLWASGMSS